MADKSISELVAASAVGSADLFVLEQGGTAKKLTGQVLENWLVSFADGHGGIQSMEYTAPVAPSLVGTLIITLADETTYTVNVTNGKGISSVVDYWAASSSGSAVPSSWQTTRQSMTSSNRYLWHYQRITYSDSTTYDTTKTVVGVYGDTGQAWYVWIRYAGQEPTSNADIGITPDNWMGVYSGTSATAPTSYTSYSWFQIKGEKGETGAPSTITAQAVEYQQSNSGTTIPTGTWLSSPPSVAQGNYLWTRTTITYNTGNQIVSYSVSYNGVDGQGSPASVTPLMDGVGAIGSSTAFAREDHVHPSDTSKADATSTVTNVAFSNGSLTKTINGNTTTVLTADTLPTQGSTSLITSGAVYDVTANKVLYLTSVPITATTGDIATILDARITADHILAECVYADPSYITTDVTWTTSAGSLVLNGTCTTATSAAITLIKKDN